MKKISVLSPLVIALCACSVSVNSNSYELNINTPKVETVHTALVNSYFAQTDYDYKDMDAAITARVDQGDNIPVKIDWTIHTEGYNSVSFKFYIKENGVNVVEYATEGTEYEFINYKINTEYTVEIVPVLDGEDKDSLEAQLIIPKNNVRTITVDGMNNFRDLGDGKHLKQGMIYRSATPEHNTVIDEDHPISISNKGKEQIQSLKLKSEIDLRKDDEKGEGYTDKSYLNLNYLKAPLYYGGQNILTYKNSTYNNPETIKGIFDFLANESNYPVNFHCVRGTDRTGCLAFLIKGLLGIEEEQLYRDYLFSNFYNIGSAVKLENILHPTNPSAASKYVNVLKLAEGDTLAEKIYNYLSSEKVGVSTENLDKIINLLKA